jgi:CBS domain containing-hemolysin-like protein
MGISAVVSATEAALLSINKVRLRHLVEKNHAEARMTYEVLTQLDRAIGTLLVIDTLVETASSAIGTWICIVYFGPQWGLVIATTIMTVVVILLGEMIPKLFAATHAEAVAFAAIRPLWLIMGWFHHVSSFFSWAARGILHLARVPMKRRSPLVTEEEIKVMIQMGREAGILAEHELRLLHRIFEFSDALVSDVMVPRSEIAAVDLDAKPEEAIDVFIEEGHSRIPVYRGSLDQIVGVIYARDLLAQVRHGGLVILADLIRPVAFTLGTKRIAELLGEFQRDKTQIAVVKDAKGATIGLVTLEDLLEEIVGEIEEAPKRRKPGQA